MTELYQAPPPRPPVAPFLTEAEREKIERCTFCGGYFKVRNLCRGGSVVIEGSMSVVKWGPWACDSCSQNGLKPLPIWEDPII